MVCDTCYLILPGCAFTPRLVILVQILALWRISCVNLFATSLLSLPRSIFFEIVVDALNSGILGARVVDNISQLILRWWPSIVPSLALSPSKDAAVSSCARRCYLLKCFEGVDEFVELLVHGDLMGSELECSLVYL